MDIDILSLFPDYFSGPFNESILKRARERGLINIRHVQIRDFAFDKHKRVDDRPYGGGPGMVLKPEPIVSAQGELLTAARCRELAQKPHLILLCGHYEGVDDRILEEVDLELSIGDYVLTNGALSAIVVVDAVVRFIPGVLGHPEAAQRDSFEEGILDYPHYTRPEVFEGKQVPEVLLQGNHQEIEKWRKEMALKKTHQARPDLYHRLNNCRNEEKNGCIDSGV
jgi:tRNA (guanine37-N1)-methyltransferase